LWVRCDVALQAWHKMIPNMNSPPKITLIHAETSSGSMEYKSLRWNLCHCKFEVIQLMGKCIMNLKSCCGPFNLFRSSQNFACGFVLWGRNFLGGIAVNFKFSYFWLHSNHRASKSDYQRNYHTHATHNPQVNNWYTRWTKLGSVPCLALHH